jgi:hypothetical protein
MGMNLWLGLYSAPGEWPWTYMFLVMIQGLFVIDPPGRVLDADILFRIRNIVNARTSGTLCWVR